jgi:hypothetical protein
MNRTFSLKPSSRVAEDYLCLTMTYCRTHCRNQLTIQSLDQFGILVARSFFS